ncbi:MAG: hypothetical protein GC146_10775 [Limimaricola sp.]|uniref:hypothetical protein n=1 Tax=Limimaricola sp. TaxID=2211665 RepID=UPI001D2DC3A7|nr:hypothetical protein [Limimaricola sp.]MBI1417694.1 hypothetical protein [Limimaricola sp.]
MLRDLLILGVAAAGLLVFLSPPMRRWQFWRAMVTPLASIIGSGFLVLGPILNDSLGIWAPLAMALLAALAYAFGAAIRYNIGGGADGSGRAGRVFETVAGWTLAACYVISVAYYLNLLGAFAVRLTPFDSPLAARIVTSAVYIVILGVGWTKGFAALEAMEKYAVSLNLAAILGLLIGLALFFGDKVTASGPVISSPSVGPWAALTLFFGILITVQGFETSRYLGDEYEAGLRVRSMRAAQIASAAIYLVYVTLLVLCFAPGAAKLTETAIIGMTSNVSPVLPIVLTAAALAAQFSASVADTTGAGGLVSERSGGLVGNRMSYAVLVAAGLALTWTADVFAIISYASRAFALYYAVEAAIAALAARREGDRRMWAFAVLCLLGIAIAALGRPVE